MPKITPDFLSKLAAHNARHNITATFSEMKKTARRLEGAFNNRTDKTISIDEYLRILYSDPTADTAVEHVMNPAECDHHANVRRRLERKAA